MTEETWTIRYGENFGYTFHYDRNVVIAWTQSDVSRHKMVEFESEIIDWYDD